MFLIKSVYILILKSVFCTRKLTFLEYVVSEQRIRVDESSKIKAINERPPPKNVGETRSFYDLVSFYRKFVKDFSTITIPLTAIIQKDEKFQ